MLHTKNIIRLVYLCITAAIIAGCGEGSDAPPANPVIKSFTATPAIVSPGQSTTLSMAFTGGTGRIVIFGNNTTATRITFGNATTIRPKVNTTYTLTVTNRAGVKVSQTVVVKLSAIQARFSSSIGSTVDTRDNHTATFLDPGKVSGPNAGKVLLAGGGTGIVFQYRKSAELYDPATSTFAATGFMKYSSASHTATLLNNGQVLFTGGWDGLKSHNEGQLYSPTTGSFAFTGSMSRPRSLHTATLLPDGTVLITGGYDGSVPLASAELYNPATGLFSSTGPMAVARSGHTATLVNIKGQPQVLIVGGSSDSTLCELYDPVSKTFTATGRMTYLRSFHTATLLPDAKVLVAGGSSGPIAELYDPVTGTFGATQPMTTVRAYHTATLLPDGRVLLAGGSDESAEFYDPDTRSFAETLRPMKEARGSHTATLLPSVPGQPNVPTGIVLLVGGTGLKNRADLFR
ncbi:MAG TPA: kelch repeat-containing protein [Geobacteraceae bacterium]